MHIQNRSLQRQTRGLCLPGAGLPAFWKVMRDWNRALPGSPSRHMLSPWGPCSSSPERGQGAGALGSVCTSSASPGADCSVLSSSMFYRPRPLSSLPHREQGTTGRQLCTQPVSWCPPVPSLAAGPPLPARHPSSHLPLSKTGHIFLLLPSPSLCPCGQKPF